MLKPTEVCGCTVSPLQLFLFYNGSKLTHCPVLLCSQNPDGGYLKFWLDVQGPVLGKCGHVFGPGSLALGKVSTDEVLLCHTAGPD